MLRVYILWTNQLFYSSIRLVIENIQFDWAGSACDPIIAFSEIAAQEPDIVFLEHTEKTTLKDVFDVIDCSPWGALIIGLNLNDNQGYVYRRKKWSVTRVEDLLEMMLTDAI